MLFVPAPTTFGNTTFSWGTTRPAAAQGSLVTPNNTTNAYGTAVQLFTALAADAFGITININSNAGSAAARNSAIQILIDPAGGTTYTELIGGLLCGSAAAYNVGAGGVWYHFPIFIPAGSTVAVAARGTVATAFRVGAWLDQRPVNPSIYRRGFFVETLGVTLGAASATGVTITPGTTAEGTWTLLGTTQKRCWWWQFGMQVGTGDTNWGANILNVDIGVGNGTVGGTQVIFADRPVTTDAAENFSKTLSGAYFDVPAGSNIYARVQNSGGNDVYNIAAYGCGG